MQNCSQKEMKNENSGAIVPTLFRSLHDNRNNNRSTSNLLFAHYNARQTKPSSIAQKYFSVDLLENTSGKDNKSAYSWVEQNVHDWDRSDAEKKADDAVDKSPNEIEPALQLITKPVSYLIAHNLGDDIPCIPLLSSIKWHSLPKKTRMC